MTSGLLSLGYKPPVGTSVTPVQLGVSSTKGLYLNFLSNLGSWQSSSTVGGFSQTNPYPAYLTNDGYPIDGPLPFGMFGAFQVPNFVTATTTLVVAWQGTIPSGGSGWNLGLPGFTVTFVQAGCTVTGGTTLSFSGTNGYAEFNFAGTPNISSTSGNTGSFSFNATSGSFSGFKGLIICRKSDYSTILNATNAGQLINPDWVNAVKLLSPVTIRGLGINDPNDRNVFTQHRYRKNWKTHISYSFPGWITTCWAGGAGTAGPNITVSSLMNYVAAAATDTPLGSYIAGEVIQGQIQTSPNMTVRGAVNNGSGLVRLTLNTIVGLFNGNQVSVASVGGVTAAIGNWTISNVGASGNSVDLVGSAFSGTYTSGGTCNIVTAFNVSGASNNGSGLIRLTVNSIGNFVNGQTVSVSNVGGVTAANNTTTGLGTPIPTWVISNVGAGGTTIDLVGSSFSGAYTSGGTVTILVTLNVGGKGQKNVRYPDGSFWTPSRFSALDNRTFIYDDLADCFVAGDAGNSSNVPIEIFIGLANQLNCNMWWNIPPHFTYINSTMEGGSNSVTQIAALTASTLNKKSYWEYANEVWNFGFGFEATGWLSNMGSLMNLGTGAAPYLNMYAYRILQNAPLIRAAWAAGGRSAADCRLVVASQGADTGSNTANFRLNNLNLAPNGTHTGTGNNLWNSYTGSADYTQVGNRVADKIDVMAYGVYFFGGQQQQFDVSYVGVSGTSFSIAAISLSNPGIVTFSSAPGYITGDRVQLSGSGFSGGMTQLNNVNVTLNQLTATTYSLYSDAALTTTIDTTLYTPYTSGGVAKIYPEVRGLTAWADLYATGIPANMTSALSSFDNDVRIGTNNGVIGSDTLYGFQDSGGRQVYKSYETTVAAYDSARSGQGLAPIACEMYEGAYSTVTMSTGSCTTLGLPTTYSTSIQNLLTAYKNSALFQATTTQYINDFFTPQAGGTRPHSVNSVWFAIDGATQWSLYPGDVYSTPYTSYTAIENYT